MKPAPTRARTPTPLMVPLTDTGGVQHLVTDAAMLLGRRTGRYRTLCGAEVFTTSLTTPEHGHCPHCREATHG